jgi:hypothetical protein
LGRNEEEDMENGHQEEKRRVDRVKTIREMQVMLLKQALGQDDIDFLVE